MAFHSELLPREAVGNTAFAVWIGLCRHATVRRRNLQLPEGCSQAQLGLASQHSVSWGCLYAWFFFTWTFVVFTFLSFSCIKQNATPILELEGPVRIPSGCTLELPPRHPDVRWAGCRHSGRSPVDLPDDRKALWQSHWVSVNTLNI